ncbi:MAG TPA: PilN domain-containing protein, partial [Desulfuromonadaceae bacterium]
MRFTINLATRPYLDQQRVKQACFASLVLLLALLAWNGSRVVGNMGETRHLAAENAAMEARLGSRPAGVSEKEYARQLASIRFFNEIIERRSRNWLGLLDQVENATPDGVTLAALTPEKGGAELKLEGRARNFAAVRSYLERLEDSHDFSDILLLSHRDLALG